MEAKDTVRMANQIAEFFKGYGHDEAVAGIADHINHFWEPRMRKHFFAHFDKGGEGYSQLVKDSASLISRPKAKAA